MSKEENYNRIERFINKELSPAEHAAFERDLLKDETFAKEVRLHRQMHLELAKKEKGALRDKLKEIVAEPIEPVEKPTSDSLATWWKWIIPILLLLALVFLYLKNQSSDKPSTIQELPPKTEETLSNTPTEDPPNLETTKEEVTPPKRPSSIPQANNETTKPQQKNNNPIAAINEADFSPNKYLEPFITSGVRGGTKFVDVQLAGAQPHLTLSNQKVTIKLSGKLEKPEKDKNYVLKIYNNQEDNYINDQALLSAPLMYQPAEGNNNTFSFNANLPLGPGLYYFVMSTKEDEEPLYVGKFKVKL